MPVASSMVWLVSLFGAIQKAYFFAIQPGRFANHKFQSNNINYNYGGAEQVEEHPMNPFDEYPDGFQDEELLEDGSLVCSEITNVENGQVRITLLTTIDLTSIQGVYEVYIPQATDSGIALTKCEVGKMSSTMISGPFTMEGVDIHILELYEPDQYFNNRCPELTTTTKATFLPTDFRTKLGNQCVSNAFTLCSVKHESGTGVPTLYTTELGIREGHIRLRCKYVYTKDAQSLVRGESDSWALSLAGFTVIKEYLDEATDQELEDLMDSRLGSAIYDPQVAGPQYIEMSLPNRLSLYFPLSLKESEMQVMTIEWKGKSLLFQLDRRISELSGTIKSLELTEITQDDAESYQPDFVHVDLLK